MEKKKYDDGTCRYCKFYEPFAWVVDGNCKVVGLQMHMDDECEVKEEKEEYERYVLENKNI